MHGDGWQTDATPVDTFRKRFDTIRAYAVRQGRNVSQFESCLHLMVNINNDREQAYREATTFLTSYYGTGTISRERTDLWLAYGPPEAVIEKIQAYLDAGCTTPGPALRGAQSARPVAALYRRSAASLSRWLMLRSTAYG